jgi:hypothetical protein
VTAEEHYWRAVTKARETARKNYEAFLTGERDDSGPAEMDLERAAIMAEFELLLAK